MRHTFETIAKSINDYTLLVHGFIKQNNKSKILEIKNNLKELILINNKLECPIMDKAKQYNKATALITLIDTNLRIV